MQVSVLIKDMAMWLGAVRLPEWRANKQIPSNVAEMGKCCREDRSAAVVTPQLPGTLECLDTNSCIFLIGFSSLVNSRMVPLSVFTGLVTSPFLLHQADFAQQGARERRRSLSISYKHRLH